MRRSAGYALSSALVAGSLLAGCGNVSCDAMMRYSTLELDFTMFPRTAGLEYEVTCLDRADQDACTQYQAGHRYSAAMHTSVAMQVGVRAVRLTVYDTASQAVVADKTLDPIPWDPPVKDGPCGSPSKAVWKF
ncbi:hypothetical protein SAMN04489743_1125 [Pseudarthrobacter equi]|uniref:Lipoprotein n=1 Tax=Pseudarthrobacter equi TaxID=728066 RepID=A0A1H1VVU6_9MICC|nr:hypothetical protein [Pseudarthrobacter equi]SDS88902.1 hypothetical protein SAMN04489743_1125 [Pseudarthrobacter equi]